MHNPFTLDCLAPCCSALAAARAQVTHVGCANPLLLNTAGNLNGLLISDAMHPTTAGCESLLRLGLMCAPGHKVPSGILEPLPPH